MIQHISTVLAGEKPNFYKGTKMKNILLWSVTAVFLSISNAQAKQHTKVNHCDYNAETYIETCYDDNNKLLNGWAVEGDEPEHQSKNQRKIRKLKRAQRRNEGNAEEIEAELKMALQPYTLSRFKNGKKDGVSNTIDYHGFNIKRVNYKNGRRHGKYETFYVSHVLQATATYKEGVLDGKAVFYNGRGKKIGVAKYKKGILIEGYCRNQNGDREAMPTDGKTVVTEVTPCPDNSAKED